MTLSRTSRITVALFTLGLLVSACASTSSTSEPPSSATVGQQTADPADVRLLAIGDSVLAWNDEDSTPAMVGAELEARGLSATIDNRAVGGSCLLYCGGDETIPSTYEAGDWTHVLVSGGGNDMGEPCRSPNELMSADLTSGAMVQLIDQIPTDTTVLLYSYSTKESWESAAICTEIRTLLDRYASFADSRANVVLVDARLVAGPDTPELWDDDVHPSPAGSRAMGRLIADLITAAA